MLSKLLKTSLVVLLPMLGVAGIFWLRSDSERLRRRAGVLHRQSEEIGRLREQNAQTKALMTRAADGGTGATQAIHSEMERARAEIAALESRHDTRPATGTPRAAELAANRDPAKGPVLIQNFSNAGQATPSAAFQTLVWAAATGDDRVAGSLVTFDAAAREKLITMIAALPETVRTKYPAPENLAALFFASVVTGHEAARVVAQEIHDAQHATVTIAFDRMSDGRPLPMQSGAGGWQLAVTEAMMPDFERQLRGPSQPPPKN